MASFPHRLLLKSILQIFYAGLGVAGYGGVDLRHVEAGGTVQVVRGQVEQGRLAETGLLPGGDVLTGQTIRVLVRVLTSTKQRVSPSQAMRSISPKRQR